MNDNGNGNGYVNLSDELKNSIEIGENSKKIWYVKSIKVYFGNDVEDRNNAIAYLAELKQRVEVLLKA